MRPDIRYGMLRHDEAAALVELAGLIWRGHYQGIISREQIEHMLAQRYQPGLIRQTLARGDRWDAARAGAELVGFAHSYAVSATDTKLDKLYVHPDYQRQGIGAALLAEVERHARGRGCGRLVLRVNRHNHNAVAAYRKYGFAVAAEYREDIGGGFVMDDYVMTKELT